MNTFYIPEPCHEKWNQMTPKEQGRHCEVCSKVVVDFTRKSQQEIDQVVSSSTPGQVCGHFRIDQLDQQAQMKVFRNPRNLFNRNWKYFAMAVLGFFALSKKSDAQKTRGRVRIGGGPVAVDKYNQNTTETKIFGTVYTPNQQTARGAQLVFLSGGKIIGKTNTITNGTYVFNFESGTIIGNVIDIRVTYQDYRGKNINGLSLTKSENRLNITLEEEMMMLGQVISMPINTKPVTDSITTQLNADTVTVKEQVCTNPVADSLPVTTAKEHPVTPVENDPTEETTPPINQLVVRPEDILATVYPNPAGTYATINCQQQATYHIELFDPKGTLLMFQSFTGQRTQLDVSALAQGTYLLNIQNEQGKKSVLKLVKQ